MSILLKAKLISLILFGTLGLGWIIYLKFKPTKMAQPLYEYEADFVKNLKTTTGKGLREWFSLMETSGLAEKPAIREWLQKQHGLAYMPAHKLSFLYAEDQELNGPQVWFSNDGRSGKVGYESREGSFTMYRQFGGGDVLAIINVPSAEQWEAVTKILLEKRLPVLHFIGQKTVERQTTGGRGSYEIVNNQILIRS